MVSSVMSGVTLKGVATCVPPKIVDNEKDNNFDPKEVKKIVAMAGIKRRHVVDANTRASDLCRIAARQLLDSLNWSADSIDALIFVTQSPDYFLPSTASLLHRDLGLPKQSAVFDVGLGCSGYPYGLWLASMILNTSTAKRVLLLNGETPSLFTHPEDRSTVLLFGDAGSASALEKGGDAPWGFQLYSDGNGYSDLIIPGGGFRTPHPEEDRDRFLHMNGTNLFNFTAQQVPDLINETLKLMEFSVDDVDSFIFHQSNQFLMRHIAKKCALPQEKTPIILAEYGNTGGPSVPLTLTTYYGDNQPDSIQRAMLLGYGVGLSWGSALITIQPDTYFLHSEQNLDPTTE